MELKEALVKIQALCDDPGSLSYMQVVDHICMFCNEALHEEKKLRDPMACPACNNSMTVTETGNTCLWCDPRARVFEECRKLSLLFDSGVPDDEVLNRVQQLMDMTDEAVAQLQAEAKIKNSS